MAKPQSDSSKPLDRGHVLVLLVNKHPLGRMLVIAQLLLVAGGAMAAVHYVDVNSTNATPPYTDWATAATNIQDAVDAALAGDQVVVTNGIYASGGRNGARVMTDRPVMLHSVNGPQFTVIDGGQSNRCVYLTNNASLSGFTLTNGASDFGGGLCCESAAAAASNCVVTGNTALNRGGGAYQGTLIACTLSGNSVKADVSDYYSANAGTYGGGAFGCILNDCTLEGNSASTYNHFAAWSDYGTLTARSTAAGGGAFGCALTNCLLNGNSAWNQYSDNYWSSYGGAFSLTLYSVASGGGASDSTLNHCVLVGNSAWNFYNDNFYDFPDGYYGSFTLAGSSTASGGASRSTLNNCELTGNTAWTSDWDSYQPRVTDQIGSYTCGGAGSSTLNNCTLSSNSDGASGCSLRNCALTGNSGLGAVSSTLNNCTLTGNSGSGASSCRLTNCILYFNSGSNYDSSSTLNYCCTTPQPTNGVGNTSQDPELASASHLSVFSPCIGKGNPAAASGTDIDGDSWANPPSIGCDEYHAGMVTGVLTVGIDMSVINVAPGFPVKFTASIEGPTDLSLWEFGDGAVEINQPYTSHAWSAPGDYVVSLWAFSDSYPGGVTATVTVHVINEVHYVAAGGTNPLAPYTSWDTAATNIQDAIAATVLPGAHVVVSNGTYAPITVFNNPVAVSSVNGAQFTIIDGGHSAPCATLGYDASLSGFTLTNGYAYNYGGAVWGSGGATLNKCTLAGNSAGGYYGSAGGGGAYGCTLNDCVLEGNSAATYFGYGDGGGAYQCVLNNCILTGNSAPSGGGGAYNSTLSNCSLIGNSGGAYSCTLSNCTLSSNSSYGCAYSILRNCSLRDNSGQGAYFSVLTNCTLASNAYGGAYQCVLENCTLAGNSGSGAYNSTLNNCAITGNWADHGGGALLCTLNNCTLTGNSATNQAGGAYQCTLNNCISYFNSAPLDANYDSASVMNYSCTTPQPTNGVGNISLEPQLASTWRLSANSPCHGAGNSAYASGTDLDGEAWGSPPSVGCDEYQSGALTGPLSVNVRASYTSVLTDFTVQFTGAIEGRAAANTWDFGDGVTVTNQPYTAHAWTALGDYTVVFRAYNESNPSGISATVILHVVAQPVHYVTVNNLNPVAPYTSWATAATNIQDAVDAATVPGALVLVTNGAYATGGRTLGGATNRVVVDRLLTLNSVNGPQFTIIDAAQSGRCVYLTNGASLSGFSLTNGNLPDVYDPTSRAASGGGVWCESSNTVLVSNCVLAGNRAGWSGGGAYGGRLVNCTLMGNSSAYGGYGGGAASCLLDHCTLSGNSAPFGGGAWNSILTHCILADNLSSNTYYFAYGGGAYQCTLNNCTLTGNVSSCANFTAYGGGACNCTLNNCVLTDNWASSSYYAAGGGAAWSTLKNSALSGNSASYYGGGACFSALTNCTLAGNSALEAAGGAYGSVLNNCILYFNTSTNGANFDPFGATTLDYCCTTPQPTNGVGNITTAPLFVDFAGGNLRLQPHSPCINAGNNLYLTNSYFTNCLDLDGNPRIAGGTVDIGAYEFQAPTSLLSYAWLQQYGLPTDGSADFTDPDGDGMNNWQEWRCGTDPTNALSVLRLLTPAVAGTNVILTWQSVAGVNYFLERSTSLAPPVFAPLATNITGQLSTTTFTDTNSVGTGPLFYRVGVGN